MKHIVYEEDSKKASDILLSLESAHLEVWRLSNHTVCVCYVGAEVKDGMFLKGVFGSGGTFEGACYDYLGRIRGKTLVFNACSDKRHEVTILG